MYIGQSVNPSARFRQHKHDAKKHKENDQHNIALYNAMNKYGVEHFHFDIIEECRVEDLEYREPYWINQLNTLVPNGYNILKGGRKLSGEDNPFFGKHHTEEAKQQMSEAHKELYIGENNPMYGRHHTDETKEKIKQKNLDKNMYEYHSRRMMNNRAWEKSKNINPIIAINHDSKQVLLFYTKARAGRYIKEIGLSNAKTPESAIRKYLDNKKYKGRLVYGFEWFYARELIDNSFFYKDISTCGQGVNCLISSCEDKIDILFKPYFLHDKDEVVNLSDCYAQINNRLMSIKLLSNHMIVYLMRGELHESAHRFCN